MARLSKQSIPLLNHLLDGDLSKNYFEFPTENGFLFFSYEK